MSFREIRPEEQEIGPLYDLLSSVVVPRPIAFVSTVSSDGIGNIAPFSYFMPGGSNPPSLCFSIAGLRPGKEKDTLRNIKQTGEFCVNLVERSIAEHMNQTSFVFDSAVNELEVVGLTPLPCVKIKPSRVAESRVHLECILFEIVSHGNGQGSANYVIGEIVCIHIAENLLSEETLTAHKYRPISRMGGRDYLDTSSLEVFTMERPQKPV
jgi:flavin reductase (DIM6/NTAB) family NADH-FMN oxidoreductase RutF